MRSAGGHVLQSAAWAEVRERQGWRAEFVRIGDPLPVALVLWRKLPAGGRIGYAPRGPIVAGAAQLATALGALETPVTPVLFPLWRFGARQRLAAASA